MPSAFANQFLSTWKRFIPSGFIAFETRTTKRTVRGWSRFRRGVRRESNGLRYSRSPPQQAQCRSEPLIGVSRTRTGERIRREQGCVAVDPNTLAVKQAEYRGGIPDRIPGRTDRKSHPILWRRRPSTRPAVLPHLIFAWLLRLPGAQNPRLSLAIRHALM